MRVYRELNCRLLLPIIKLCFSIISLLTPLTVSWRCCWEFALELRHVGVLVNLPVATRNGARAWLLTRFCSLRTDLPWGRCCLKRSMATPCCLTRDPKRASFRSCYFSLLFLTSCRNQNASVHCCRVKEGCLHVDGILQIEKIF